MKVIIINILRKMGLAIGRMVIIRAMLLCCCAVAQAQDFPLTKPQAKDFPFAEAQFERVGDAESGIVTITALAQDARGLIWIGTQNGLIRYDGYRFRKFANDINDPFSLAADKVLSLWAGRDGRIWVGTANDGLSVFDPASERFENFRHDAKVPDSLGAGRIFAIIGDERGGVWIGTSQGLDHLPASTRRFVHFRHDNNRHSLLDGPVGSLLLDKTGRLWVGSKNGLQRMAKDGKSFETIATGVAVPTLFQAQDGKLWLGTTKHGAAWLIPSDGAERGPTEHGLPQVHWLPLAQPSPASITNIAQVQTDQIWLATVDGGIHVVAANDGHPLQTLRHDPSLPGSLALNTVISLLLDRAGWLWVGTDGGGLQRNNTNNAMLRILRHSPKQPVGLSHADISSALELANGQLLFGSKGNGIDVFDRQRGLIGGYRPHPGAAQGDDTHKGSAQIGTLPDSVVLALAQTPDGTIWASTRQSGLLRQLVGTNSWVAVSGLAGLAVRRLFVSRDGGLWVSTNRGVAHWRPGANATSQGHANQPDFETLADEQGKPMQSIVSAFAEDGQGRIWMGTGDGLWLHEPGRRGLIAIPAAPNQPGGLVSNTIWGLLFDRRGWLWISTDRGLERLQSWDGKRAQFEHVISLFGQLDKELGGNLMEDKAGRIWTEELMIEWGANARGANAQFQMRSTPITRADGMDIGARWIGAHTKTRDGLLLFGGTLGVAILDPSRYKPYNYVPPVVAVALTINGQATPLGSLANLPDKTPAMLTLTPEQRSFALEFAALDYSAPKKNRYQYRLQGYDKDWINTDADHRSAAYGNLPPGEYLLAVRGSNRLGVFNPQELHITLRVLPAWWQTAWFRALLLLLMGGAIYGGVRWRVAALRKKALALQKLVAARTADIVKLGEIGQELTSTLDMEQAFERIWKQVSARLDAYVFLIGLYDEAAAQIMFVYEIENQTRQPNSVMGMSEHERPAVWCVRERRELATGTHAGLLDYVSTILPPISGELPDTIVYLPLLVEQRVIGCLSVQSLKQHAYNPDQLEFLRVLASYTAIALSNSTAHAELAQSHTDLAATHLHLQETQQQLLLQEKMAGLGTLTAGVAHEINNPTNFAHVAAQILQVEIAEFEQFLASLIEGDENQEILQAFSERFAKLSSNVGTVLNGTERIKGIVKDLRSFTRLDESERKTVRLSECLLSTVNLVRTSWLEQVEFINDFTADPELECWPALLNQVFMNLLVNGCQAIEEKYQLRQRGKLWLRLRSSPAGDLLEIDFEDNGIGIDPAIHARIMEPFFTTKEVGSGSGLGLSTSFGIVQKHGGTLEFRSVPGQGSCFTVKLPLPAP